MTFFGLSLISTINNIHVTIPCPIIFLDGYTEVLHCQQIFSNNHDFFVLGLISTTKIITMLSNHITPTPWGDALSTFCLSGEAAGDDNYASGETWL